MDQNSLGLGCMGMTGFYGKVDRNRCFRTIATAIEHGITLLDTADNYGFGDNEVLVGHAVASCREKVRIATKVGVVSKRDNPAATYIDGSPRYVKEQCKRSLKRLGVDVIDLYYLHHLDHNTPIEETIQAMAELVAEGLVRHIGLCEMGVQSIRRAHAIHPIAVVQAEYSLFSRTAEERLLPLCKELGIGFVACAPICRGLLSGASFAQIASDDFRRYFPRFQSENLAHNLLLVKELRKMAKEKRCSLSQLSLAWVAAKGSFIAPLFGTTEPTHVVENTKKVPLTEIEIERIGEIGKGVRGDRHTEMMKKLYP
ncbi:MAG TPA: aldo/keto reductase [Chlamydiales bacterium]|nr:aldo/keto reductase [Chlamydiales bacterium]